MMFSSYGHYKLLKEYNDDCDVKNFRNMKQVGRIRAICIFNPGNYSGHGFPVGYCSLIRMSLNEKKRNRPG